MKLRLYQVDAFASRPFAGNPAAVVPLERWIDDTLLQSIAEENNLSETAFFVPIEDGYRLRWFTPVAEVDLCGHATLATAHVLFEILGEGRPAISFQTRSGKLVVRHGDGGVLTMDFPARPPVPVACPDDLAQGLGVRPREVLAADDYVAVFETEEEIRLILPDAERLRRLDMRGVAVTAPGRVVDFVSRFFAPALGIPEDPVTGSAHCALAPYWQTRLGKSRFVARQVSRRGGELVCEVRGDRVLLTGRAVTYLQGEIILPTAAEKGPPDGR